jgi:hypothetical protein
MDRKQVVRWIAHRINNKDSYTDFDINFLTAYINFIHPKADIKPQQLFNILSQYRGFRFGRQLAEKMQHAINHMREKFDIVFIEHNKKIIGIK